MTIEEAIKHCLEVAEQEERNSKTGNWFEGEDWNIKAREQCAECAANHRQLAEWLTELMKKSEQIAEYKRLLKAAVEDINWINEHTQDDDGSCIMRTNSGCSGCPLDINGDLFCKWKHNDEALKLIEKGENDEG